MRKSLYKIYINFTRKKGLQKESLYVSIKLSLMLTPKRRYLSAPWAKNRWKGKTIMAAGTSQGMRKQIIEAAEKLFRRKGYVDTSIEEIIELAGCSKSTFYHYFDSKDELSSAPDQFDEEYLNWYDSIEKLDIGAIDLLMQLNQTFLKKNEMTYDMERAIAICRHQVSSKKGDRYLSPSRPYNRIIRRIILDGQEKGEIRRDVSAAELCKIYSMIQRGTLFDWCISGGTYSFQEFGMRSMGILLEGFRPQREDAAQ